MPDQTAPERFAYLTDPHLVVLYTHGRSSILLKHWAVFAYLVFNLNCGIMITGQAIKLETKRGDER